MITQERLKELFRYDENTGQLIRIKKVNKANVGDILGTNHNKGYLTGRVDGKRYQVHRLIWLFNYGYIPEQVGHINRDKKDNRLANLRDVDNRTNTKNCSINSNTKNCSINSNTKNCSINSNNTSGCIGVSYHKRDDVWNVKIVVDYKQIHIGNFKDKDEAIKARKEAELKYGFHKNHNEREVA